MAFLFCVAIAGNIRSPALSQKAALHLPFPITTPPVKKEQRNARRRSAAPKSKILFPLTMPSNDDDRRQWRKQGGVVGAAASKTQVPPKARCGCWVPQPVRRGGHSNRYTPRKGHRITSGRSVLPPRPCGWPSWWRCAPRCGCRRTSPRSRTLPCLPAQPAGRFPAQGRSGSWENP